MGKKRKARKADLAAEDQKISLYENSYQNLLMPVPKYPFDPSASWGGL